MALGSGQCSSFCWPFRHFSRKGRTLCVNPFKAQWVFYRSVMTLLPMDESNLHSSHPNNTETLSWLKDTDQYKNVSSFFFWVDCKKPLSRKRFFSLQYYLHIMCTLATVCRRETLTGTAKRYAVRGIWMLDNKGRRHIQR